MALTRTFLAIELDEPTRAFIRERVSTLAPELPGVRFVAPATWHITLAFLGELDDAQLAATQAAARQAAATTGPFTLHVGRGGTFGRDDAPTVIWLGVAGMTTALFALQQQIVAALHAHHIAFNETRYVPHITLTKLRDTLTPPAAQALRTFKAGAIQGPPMPVTAISVMKSELAPTGAHYTALAHAILTPPR